MQRLPLCALALATLACSSPTQPEPELRDTVITPDFMTQAGQQCHKSRDFKQCVFTLVIATVTTMCAGTGNAYCAVTALGAWNSFFKANWGDGYLDGRPADWDSQVR